MDIGAIQREFSLRYYQWAKNDMYTEIKQGFPHLGRFKWGSSACVVRMMSKMSSAEQLTFGLALVKRFHKEAASIARESPTQAETALCQQYRQEALNMDSHEIAETYRALERKAKPLNRNAFEAVLKSKLGPLSLMQFKQKRGGLWFCGLMGHWNIDTLVEVKGRYNSVVYEHNIHSIGNVHNVVSKSGENLKLPLTLGRQISLDSWLGISSETEWAYLQESDFEEVALHLATLCSHFFAAIPMLLTGLVPISTD
jgi:hypothetical protein